MALAFVSEFHNVAAQIIAHCFHSIPNRAASVFRERAKLFARFFADLDPVAHTAYPFARSPS
jgi:hypothetical protein